MESYRPISIVTFKKTIMKTWIVGLEYFKSNNVFSESQHGFRRNQMTVTSFLYFIIGAVLDTCESGGFVALTLAGQS